MQQTDAHTVENPPAFPQPGHLDKAIKAVSALMLRGPVVDVLHRDGLPTFHTSEVRVVILADDWEIIKAGLGAFANELVASRRLVEVS